MCEINKKMESYYGQIKSSELLFPVYKCIWLLRVFKDTLSDAGNVDKLHVIFIYIYMPAIRNISAIFKTKLSSI